MNYEALAIYYDLLINEEDAQLRYLEFVIKHTTKLHNLLELGCGSGTLANMLLTNYPNLNIDASDLSSQMIEVAKKQYPRINFLVADMRSFEMNKVYDTIICFCDSLNYLLLEDDVIKTFKQVWHHLEKNGCFIFDAHSTDRLVEFSSEYDEANTIDDLEYTWHIKSEGDYIYQTLRVWDDSIVPTYFFEEKHQQRVYKPEWLVDCLEKIGFKVEVSTDFDLYGIKEGEKQFFVCKKEG